MSSKLSEMFVEIRGDQGPLDNTLGALRGQLQRQGQMMGLAFRSALGFLVGREMLQGFGAVLKGGSDLKEQLGAVGYTFGDSAKVVTAGIDDMAARFGMVRTEAYEAAVGLGSIFKASGLTREAAAQASVQFTKLAADLSSFRNVPMEEALMAIRSGLVGEAEPLRRFGVLMNEAEMKSEAARLGLAKYGDELTEAQKTQARMSLIMKGLADAQGNLEATADDAANSQRNLQGQITNMAAEIGMRLQPALTDVLSGIRAMVGGVKDWVDSNGQLITQWANTFRENFAVVGVIIRNFGEFWEIAALTAQQHIGNILAVVDWLGRGVGEFLGWLSRNWINIFRDTFSAAVSVIRNAFGNIVELFQAMGRFLETGEWNPEFTGLLDGFQAAVEELPKIAGPAWADMSEQINAIGERMAGREIKRQEDIQKAMQATAQAGAAAAAGGGAPIEKKQKKEKSSIVDISEFARKIQQGIGDTDSKRLLNETKKQTGFSERSAKALEEIMKKTPLGMVPGMAI